MAKTDAIVLGAGIVGVSVALHLVKRGLSVALVDRGDPRRGTSYGNAGIIEANALFPAAFPAGLRRLAAIALKRAGEADYHAAFLPNVAPWLLAFRRNSSPERLIATMEAMRPLFARAIAEHEALMAEAGAQRPALPAPHRLAQALSQRSGPGGDEARALARGRAWHAAAASGHGGRPGA
jgi:D-amino-acid dehydrogenase